MQKLDTEQPVLLVVDDEEAILRAFEWVFRKEGVRLLNSRNGLGAIEMVREHRPDAVILDVNLPDITGLEVFRRIREEDTKVPVVFITGRGTTDTAIEATKLGALDYLFKPLDLHKLRDVAMEALDVGRRMRVPAIIEEHGEPIEDTAEVLVGRCEAMKEVYQQIGRVAPLDDPVLILGESGTGKELVARAIWCHGRRSQAPLLAVNCAAIPESLLESELFGHEKGAFTGADRQRIGRFEQCSGGTLFLDEIGDMTPRSQAKILRVLQEQRFERVGGTQTIQTNVRIIAATNRKLGDLLPSAEFRSDLYYRLSVFAIRLPPLRERDNDLQLLVDHFLRRFRVEMGKEVKQAAPETVQALVRYSWPGNVRELQSVLKQAMIQATGPVLYPESLPARFRNGQTDIVRSTTDVFSTDLGNWDATINENLQSGVKDLYNKLLSPIERHLLVQVLRHTGGNQLRAAAILGMHRSTLRTKIRMLGIEVEPAQWPKFDQA